MKFCLFLGISQCATWKFKASQYFKGKSWCNKATRLFNSQQLWPPKYAWKLPTEQRKSADRLFIIQWLTTAFPLNPTFCCYKRQLIPSNLMLLQWFNSSAYYRIPTFQLGERETSPFAHIKIYNFMLACRARKNNTVYDWSIIVFKFTETFYEF